MSSVNKTTAILVTGVANHFNQPSWPDSPGGKWEGWYFLQTIPRNKPVLPLMDVFHDTVWGSHRPSESPRTESHLQQVQKHVTAYIH